MPSTQGGTATPGARQGTLGAGYQQWEATVRIPSGAAKPLEALSVPKLAAKPGSVFWLQQICTVPQCPGISILRLIAEENAALGSGVRRKPAPRSGSLLAQLGAQSHAPCGVGTALPSLPPPTQHSAGGPVLRDICGSVLRDVAFWH